MCNQCDDETFEDMVEHLNRQVAEELARRPTIYPDQIAEFPFLAEACPFFELTDTADGHGCHWCTNYIPGGELHFVLKQARVCHECGLDDVLAHPPRLRLVAVDGRRV